LELDLLHEINKRVVEVDGSVILQQLEGGKVRVSVRTKEMDALEMVAPFGGGGHKRAAGATVEGMELHEVQERVVEGLFQNFI
jgi:phosphoesterase RecJ-like protein